MKEFKEIPKENPFKVPANYFEELEGRILKATIGADQQPARNGLIRRLLPYMAVAASVALLAIIGYTVLYTGSDGNGTKIMSEITVNEFTDNYFNDIDLITLEDKVAESGLFIEKTGVNKEVIIDYLVNENIDVSDIYENL